MKALLVYLFTEHIQLEEVIFCSDKNPGLIFQTWSGMAVHAYKILTLRRMRQEDCELEDSLGYRETT